MIKIKDIDGKPLNGHIRGSNGSIVVNDPNLYERYKIEKQQRLEQKNKIQSLENELMELKQMLLEISKNKS
jgi:hypothetical protein